MVLNSKMDGGPSETVERVVLLIREEGHVGLHPVHRAFFDELLDLRLLHPPLALNTIKRKSGVKDNYSKVFFPSDGKYIIISQFDDALLLGR